MCCSMKQRNNLWTHIERREALAYYQWQYGKMSEEELAELAYWILDRPAWIW